LLRHFYPPLILKETFIRFGFVAAAAARRDAVAGPFPLPMAGAEEMPLLAAVALVEALSPRAASEGEGKAAALGETLPLADA
jgi:hypothetical protein